MGFYNVLQGDVPYFKALADTYAMSDNFHQSIQGGTGANHIALGTGDADWYSDGKGHAAVPPSLDVREPRSATGDEQLVLAGRLLGRIVQRLLGRVAARVKEVTGYLHGVGVKPNCERGHYYLLNNYDPGYLGDGTVDAVDEFAIPPSSTARSVTSSSNRTFRGAITVKTGTRTSRIRRGTALATSIATSATRSNTRRRS